MMSGSRPLIYRHRDKGKCQHLLFCRNKGASDSSTAAPASPGLSTPSKLILVAIVTSCWYWCSSVNAIASQKLFHRVLQELQDLAENNDDDGNNNINNDNHTHDYNFVVPLLVTTMQLFTGSIISIICVCFFILSKEGNKDRTKPSSVLQLFIQQFTTRRHYAIGLFHFIGCLSTNISFGYGSAVLVQVIKLLEPIETLLLTALATRSMESLSVRKVFSTVMIMSGTSMLLGQQQKSSLPVVVGQKSYNMCVYFALSSGFCLASRNVLTKKKDGKVRGQQQQQQEEDDEESCASSSSSSKTTTNTCREVFQKGLLNFATITIMSTLPAIIAISFYSWHYPKVLQLLRQHPSSSSSSEESIQILLPQTVIFHCLYNMASITVLSLTSAPVHSLLNVGKRIANVICASMVFGTIIPKAGKVGLIIVGAGTLIYSDKILAMLCISSSGGGSRKKSLLQRMTAHRERINAV